MVPAKERHRRGRTDVEGVVQFPIESHKRPCEFDKGGNEEICECEAETKRISQRIRKSIVNGDLQCIAVSAHGRFPPRSSHSSPSPLSIDCSLAIFRRFSVVIPTAFSMHGTFDVVVATRRIHRGTEKGTPAGEVPRRSTSRLTQVLCEGPENYEAYVAHL
jgi:hypothetical protein